MKKKLFSTVLTFFLLFSSQLMAHDWTYKVTSSDTKDYYMWTPYVKNIRGIILATSPGYLSTILGDTAIRRICQEEQLAIVAAKSPSYGGIPTIDAAKWTELQNGLKALALQSGYPEVEFAPICTYGHSTEGIAAYRLALYKPSRFFGVVQEGATFFDNAGLTSVPLISSRGTKEKIISKVGDNPNVWITTKNNILNQRNAGELANIIFQPGAAHFGWYKFEQQYLAMWLKKASQRRIPVNSYATSGEITLNVINEQDGWLTDTLKTVGIDTVIVSAITPLSYSEYVATGKDPKKALWHFDKQIADYWVAIHNEEAAKTPITVTFNNGHNNDPFGTTFRYNINTSIDLSATVSPVSLPVRIIGFWNGGLPTSSSTGIFSPCMQATYGFGPWWVVVSDGDASHQASENAFKTGSNGSVTNQTFTYNDIADKVVSASPFAFGATYSSNAAESFIISGAVKPNGGNLEIEKFYKGVSTAEVCYAYQSNRSNPTDKFNITWASGFWAEPNEYTDGVKGNLIATENATQGNVYPNPAKNYINIKDAKNNAPVIIYNYNGQSVLNTVYTGGAIDISTLKNGLYIVKVGTHTEKLMVE